MVTKLTSADMLFMIEEYLKENFEFRYNLLSKYTEVRERNEDSKPFRRMTEMLLNTIIRNVKKDVPEVTGVKQNVQEFLLSEDITQYNPIQDYLNGLPQWDGQNRVAELFGRIPGISGEQIYWLNIWFRSAVAHWLGMDTLHGNECVPTFIGAQGCGKSTFCQRLLPSHLRVYYLDHINLSNKFDKEMALTNNLLVNIDELDQIKTGQQAQLKQALSKSKVNGRPIYGREQHDRVRYASFIATTNNQHPLQDPTGSRRYICIRIPDCSLIDNEANINYEQLFAQLLHEVRDEKMRYWFTNEETRQIQHANAPYQKEQDIDSMIEACFRLPKSNENVKPTPIRKIVDILSVQYPEIEKTHSFKINVGRCLTSQGFHRKDLNIGSAYEVVPLK